MPYAQGRFANSSYWLVALLFGAIAPADLRADTTIDSGTTTVSTGTTFGTNLYVGYSSTATLEVLTGGSATNTNGYLGYNAGSNGTARVTGGVWTNTGDLYVGASGNGSLNVSGGGVTNQTGALGLNAGSNGTATVTGGTWASSNELTVGNSGTGTLNVNGGSVTSNTGVVGRNRGSFGTATVTSGTWANSGDLYVGLSGAGTLTVSGGSVNNASGNLYLGDNGTGTLNINSGSVDHAGGFFYIGESGTGALNVNGGSIDTGYVRLGFTASSKGTATVSSGTWVSTDLLVTYGTLTMTGGLVKVLGTLSKNGPGTINLNAGGTLQIGGGGVSGDLDVATLANNGTLIFNRSTASTYTGIISGSGAVTKQGAGQLTLAGANFYSGRTTISGGTIALSGTGSVGTGGLSLGTNGVFDLTALTSSTYSLPSTGNLTGAGTLSGNAKTLAVLGSFVPGTSPGTVTIGPGFTLDLTNAGSSVFEITSPAYTAGSYDFVNGAGSAILGGTLILDFSGGTYADGTDVLRLFANAGGRTGGFAAVNSMGLADGQYATFNATTGFISIVPEPATYALAAIGASLAGMMWTRRR